MPWLALPGNHDIGDVDDDEHPVDDDRGSAGATLFGDLWWATALGGWRLVGIDIQTLASTSPAADEHWAWLQERSPATARRRCSCTVRCARGATRPRRSPPLRHRRPPRRACSTLVASAGVRVVASGHVHQHLVTVADGVVPRLGAVDVGRPARTPAARDRHPSTTGVIELVLDDDGEATAAYVRPAGMVDAVIGESFPSPYTH